MSLNGWTLTELVIMFAVVLVTWHYRRIPRLVSTGIVLICLVSILAIPIWRDSLANAFATGPGMITLILVTAGGIGGLVWDHRKGHHPIRSSAFGGAGALGGGMVFLMWPVLRDKMNQFGPQTKHAMSTAVQQVHSGAAAHAVTGSTRNTVLIVAALVVLVAYRLARRSHQKRPWQAQHVQPHAIGGRSQRAITAGSGPGSARGGGKQGGGRGQYDVPGFAFDDAGVAKQPGMLARGFQALTGGGR